jgi:phosphatidylethanolamine/phosphatidyl-N-methylethanolamine N-methyltransferase
MPNSTTPARQVPPPLDAATVCIRGRYDRLAPFYDLIECGAEASRFREWRTRLSSDVRGQRILELGVCTGKNMPHYPPGAEVTAIDVSLECWSGRDSSSRGREPR